jgi:hypothetical protein
MQSRCSSAAAGRQGNAHADNVHRSHPDWPVLRTRRRRPRAGRSLHAQFGRYRAAAVPRYIVASRGVSLGQRRRHDPRACAASSALRAVVEGGKPFADAKWDETWKTTGVDGNEWQEIRGGLRDAAQRWTQALGSPRDVSEVELAGMIASIAHKAGRLGAIRQIDRDLRGPREGSF